MKGAQHVIMLGDHYQLPPTVKSDRALEGYYFDDIVFFISAFTNSFLTVDSVNLCLSVW